MKALFSSMFKNWKTTVTGIGILSAVGHAAYANPAILLDAPSITGVLGGLGLIFASDSATSVLTTTDVPAAK